MTPIPDSYFVAAALVLAFIFAFVTRLLVRREVDRQMWLVSDEQTHDLAGIDPNEELDARQPLQLQFVDADTPQPEASRNREELIDIARRRSRWVMIWDISSGIAFMLLLFLETDLGMLGITIGFFALLRYLFFGSQFRPYQTGLVRVVGGAMRNWLMLADPDNRIYIIGVVIVAAAYSAVDAALPGYYPADPREALVIAAGTLLLIATTWHLKKRAAQTAESEDAGAAGVRHRSSGEFHL